MTVRFQKWQALGNDFIVIEGVPNLHIISILPKLCHRLQGIGADGVIFLDLQSDLPKMVFYNADASLASMCGNGLRVVMLYLEELKKPKECEFAGRIYHAYREGDSLFVLMPQPKILAKSHIPYEGILVDAGVPHFLIETKNLKGACFDRSDFENRYHSYFNAHGSNLTFFEKKGSLIHLRTLERGVDIETQSCGSAAIACSILSDDETQTMVYQTGNTVTVLKKDEKIYLAGEARRVYSGFFLESDFI